MTTSLTVGDTEPALVGQAKSDGGGVNLTGATLTLHLERPDGTLLLVTPAIVDAMTGVWRYAWAVGEVSVAGLWTALLHVTYASGRKQTFGPSDFPVAPHRSH